ncbi:MAG: 50S ribosomal protein L10 [Candidatus Binatia bacterium]
MNRQEKADQVALLTEKFNAAPITILSDYSGLDVAQMTTLRRQIRQADGEVIVAKNRLALLAVQDSPYSDLNDLLRGPTAFAFGFADPVGVAKVLADFAEDNEALDIKGGVLEGELLDASRVMALATMPSRDEIRAQLLALLTTPATQFVRLLQTPAQQFAQVLSARSRQEDS